MPSLQTLGEFKSSFSRLGDELQIRAELELPPDELLLPPNEPVDGPVPGAEMSPEAFDETGEPFADGDRQAGDSQGSELINFGDLGDFLGGDMAQPEEFAGGDSDLSLDASEEFPEELPGSEEAEFGAFIDSIPDTFDQTDDGGALSGMEDEEDTGLPPGLLNGFADEIEEAGRDTSADDDFDLDDDFSDIPGEDLTEDFSVAEPAGGDDLGLGDDFAGEDFSVEDLSGDDLLSDDSLGDDFADLGLDEIPGEELSEAEPEMAGEVPGEDNGNLDRIDSVKLADVESGGSVELFSEEGSIGIPESDDEFSTADLPGDEDFGGQRLSSEEAAGESFGDEILGDETLGDFEDFASGESPELAAELPAEDFAAGMDSSVFDDSAFDGSGESLFDEGAGLGAGDGEEALDLPAVEEIPLAVEEGITGAEGGDETDFSDDDDSFDMGEGSADFDTSAVLEEISGDSFDNFKLDSDALAGNFDLGGEAAGLGEEFNELEEFSLSGIDNVFDGASAPVKPGAARGRGRAARKEVSEVEEINLTDDELEELQKTLSSYPLNLRIACEELIAEQVVAPDLMSRLVKLLITGASAKETAVLAGQILGRTISIPKGFEKKTGAALEEEQSSFAYIFVHNFLPVLRLFMMAALLLLSVGYLSWKFIYTPLKAESIYKLGYERIAAGEYSRANDRFLEAYKILPKKPWFYRYARAFRGAKQYTLAEEKYRELLYFTASKNKRRIPEKSAVLEYADMETNDIGNYQSADEILRHNILDYYPFDRDALLALGDNSLAWGEYEYDRYEDAREYYAQYMERYGRSDPLLERMLKYFIRTDVLEEVLALQTYFMASASRQISAPALAEMGGYLLDKRYEKVKGVPNQYLDAIGGIREILLRAVRQDSMLPESYYHLARYYRYFENYNDEKLTLDLAVRVFDAANEGSPKRIGYHIDTLSRYGEVLIKGKEFFPAEETLIKGINIYQDALSRRLLKRSPEFGRLYANLGDLEYFVKDGDMRSALDYYRLSELNGWVPPEIQYRMGAASFQLRQWGAAQDYLLAAYRETQPNRRILYALGNVSYMRGNYFAAQGYYDRLLDMLNSDRERLPVIIPSDDEKEQDLAERLMVAQNNMGVVLEALTDRTGNNSYRSRAQGLYADSQRAWDVLTRNPRSMTRMRPSPEINAPSVNPAYLNVQNSLRPVPGYDPQFFLRIDKDLLESSPWEELAPPGYRLSEGIYTGR